MIGSSICGAKRRRNPTATYTRKAKAASAKPLAYDAGSEALITGLLEIVPDLETDARDTTEATIWLPGANGRPAASSPLIAEPVKSKAKATIDAWTVTTLPMTTAGA